MINGPVLFSRFAYPPNSLGYCGPEDTELLADMLADGSPAEREFRRTIESFAGAWPYLELLGGCAGLDPLDARVVEAYWLGNELLARVDSLTWGNSLDDRFRGRAGSDWDRIVEGMAGGGVPNHAFHVFCAYPWVGLLRSGAVDQAMTVLDNCRIRWGTVVGRVDERLLVESQPLSWDGMTLGLGAERVEHVRASIDTAESVSAGDRVAMHWDYVCQRLSSRQLASLQRQHGAHLALVNRHPAALAARVE
ncbi:MAG: hypothetical protein HKN91_05375 [Acidimicrobiia bacterium]|nr:hypothetical protein [Acidimicrobiia bacterium]